mgnify:FL=1
MVKSDDYRLYLEERFKEQRDSLNEIKVGIADINSHLKQLNDKVVEHEKYIVYANGVIEHRRKQAEDFEKKFVEIEEEIKKHPVTCPNFSEIKAIKDDLEEYRFFKKYPKIAALLILTIVVGSIYFFLSTRSELKGLMKRVDMINTPIQMRDGSYVLYPSGMVCDSLINESGNK